MAELDQRYAERNLLTDAEFDQSKALDKALLALSGGALGLSLTFIKNIVPPCGPQEKWLLLLSWTFFGLSILSTLLSFVASIAALRSARAGTDMLIRQIPAEQVSAFDQKQSWKHGVVDWCVGLSFLCFILGILCIGAFVWLNFA